MKKEEAFKLCEIRETFADIIRRYDKYQTLSLTDARALLIQIDTLIPDKLR